MKDFFYAGRNVIVLALLIVFTEAVTAMLSIRESKTEYVMSLAQLASTLAGILGGILLPRDMGRRSDSENTSVERKTTVEETAVTTTKPEEKKGD